MDDSQTLASPPSIKPRTEVSEEPSKRSISPPPIARKRKREDDPAPTLVNAEGPVSMPSPIHLTRVQGLPDDKNVDTLSLTDLIGDNQVVELWSFNYLFNIDFHMSALHETVRDNVQVRIVHGSWRDEDSNRQLIEEALPKWSNCKVFTAFMPEPFGTHHTKMMIVFRRDQTAQVIITTANMIPIDWSIMTQAVWRSPRLPPESGTSSSSDVEDTAKPFGSGARFKHDILNYLIAYKSKTAPLVTQLKNYDFSSVRAVLIGSVPMRQSQNPASRKHEETLWGWPGLREILQRVPLGSDGVEFTRPTVVSQISSIASLGSTDAWLENLLQALATPRPFGSPRPHFRIMFPSSNEIRASLGGYRSGDLIHSPDVRTTAQKKQLDYLRAKMVYWAGDKLTDTAQSKQNTREAGRCRAAPHIKTYIRFSSDACQTIDWAMVTSANLSKQAWGDLPNKDGEVRISSWELGVIVWPELSREPGHDSGRKIKMVPTFGTNDVPSSLEHDLVGFRMPYDLPLKPYEKHERMWSARVEHSEPDWQGNTWHGKAG